MVFSKAFKAGFEKQATGLGKLLGRAEHAALDYSKIVKKSPLAEKATSPVLDYSKIVKKSPLAEKPSSPVIDYAKVNKPSPPPAQTGPSPRMQQVMKGSTPKSHWERALQSKS